MSAQILTVQIKNLRQRSWSRSAQVTVLLTLILFIFGVLPCRAQAPKVYSSAEIGLLLQKLTKTGSVLYFAAHPDDENNRLLSYLGKGRNLRTGYLALNRGEGGQNLIGDEQGDALGLIRTNELLGARSVDGATQFFTRAYDFGYSKNPAETFSIWNRDSVLADAVWVIRLFRPDMIIDRFPTTGEGGHGHHTASAILSVEAVTAAADPARFPDQLRYVSPWKVRSLYWNTFNFGGMNTTAADQFKINVGGYSPLLGKSYGELAAEGRSFHKSQGFGSAASRGKEFEFLKLIKGEAAKTDLLDGTDTSWNRIEGGQESGKWAMKALLDYDPEKPEQIVPDLLAAYKGLAAVKDPFWVSVKRAELITLIQGCSGLYLSATSSEGFWSARSVIPLTLSAICRTPVQVKLTSVTLNGKPVKGAVSVPGILPFNEPVRISASFQADPLLITQPYWLKNTHTTAGYNLTGQDAYRSFAVNPAAISADFTLDIEGTVIVFSSPVLFHSVNPASGESYQPLQILNPVSIQPKDALLIFKGAARRVFSVRLIAYEDNLSGNLLIHLPTGYSARSMSMPYMLAHKGDKTDLHFDVSLGKGAPAVDSISFSTILGSTVSNQTVHDLEYAHIPHITWMTPAVIKVISPAITVPAGTVGYLAGAGDLLPPMLEQLGYKVSVLTDRQAMEEDLSRFDAIITGVRAYNTRTVLRDIQPRLMAYVKAGGCLISQYNRPNDLVTENLGPYPFEISARRITNELAPVRFTEQASNLLNYPNKITADDFKGWIQERAIYVPVSSDPHYHSPISMSDPGESDLPNTLLYARYGKGAYIYTGLVFFRELPAGVPGAIRLFVNLINAAKAKTTADE